MLHEVGLARPHPGPRLCAESAKQPLVPTRLLGTGPQRTVSYAQRSCRMTVAEIISCAHGRPSWRRVPEIEKRWRPLAHGCLLIT